MICNNFLVIFWYFGLELFQAQEIGSTLNDTVIKPSTEQASKLGTVIHQNVVEPTKTKVQDGTLWTDVSKGATSFASTVSTQYILPRFYASWSNKFNKIYFMLQVASVGEKHWRGLQSYLNDAGSVQNGDGDEQFADDEWGGWDTKGDDDVGDKDTTDNGWDDAEWNSTEWNSPKSKLKPKANNSFTKKKEDTSSNGWDNVDMDQWNDADWTPSKQRTKGD